MLGKSTFLSPDWLALVSPAKAQESPSPLDKWDSCLKGTL